MVAEQHIGKSQMVELVFNHREWNRGLHICTCSLACLSIAPYVRIIMQDQESLSPTWTYPLLCIVGSAVSIVAQFIIQIRVAEILQTLNGVSDEPR
jgi:hypothetical protein